MASTSAGNNQNHSSDSNQSDNNGPQTRTAHYGDGELATRKLAKRLQRYRRLAVRNRWARSSRRNMSLMDHLTVRKWNAAANGDIVRMARNHEPFMYRLDHRKNLPVHDGCVNTICWNATGEYILSGSDDCNLCITKPGDMFNTRDDYSVLIKVPTRHLGNIFCARFIPNSADGRIVSCSSEGPIIVHDIYSTDPSEGIFNFNCHSETIYDVAPLADDDKVFLSCGEDKTVRLFDMRVHRSCARAGTCPHPALIRNSHAITTLHINPLNSNLLLVGRADGMGLVYDRRKLPDVTKFTRERAHAERLAGAEAPSYQFKHPLEGVVGQFCVPEMDERYRFTSLCYNDDGTEVLASYSGDYIYLFDHDKSSNFRLVQTLPAKSAVSEDSLSDQISDNDGQSATGADSIGRSQSESSNGNTNQPAARSPRSARISRIRVRGDWSDTGVNSVPLSSSHRARDGQVEGGAQGGGRPRPTSFLEQVAVRLGTRGSLGRPNRAAEIIAGPIRWNVPPTNEASNRQERPIVEEEEEEEEEGEGEEDEDDDDNSTLIDDDEDEHEDEDENRDDSDDSDEDRDNHDNDDDDEDEDYERYAERTVRDLMDEASVQAQRITNESTMMDIDSESDSITGAGRASNQLGLGAREKFKRTLQNLKSKYNNIPNYRPRVKYQGHRNSRTSVKESIFWGDNFIMSGSDCGRIMVWEKETAKLVMAFQADERVVNCLAPNPCTYVLASSGIDYDIKLWSTQALKEGPLVVGDAEMQRIIENNEEMLEESRYTLSVPPHLFFRVLASLVHPSR